jgi:hypothetical protein
MKIYCYSENCAMAGRVAAVDPEPDDVSGDWFLWGEGDEAFLVGRARSILESEMLSAFNHKCARFAAERLCAAAWDRSTGEWSYRWDEFADGFDEDHAEVLATAADNRGTVYQNEELNQHIANYCADIPSYLARAVEDEIRSRR